MQVVHSARYHVDIGPHVFPTHKYHQVLDRLLEAGLVGPSDLIEAQPASWDELGLVHTAEYLDKMRLGTLSADELAQLELPWSVDVVEAFRTMVGGTIEAARLACGLRSTDQAGPGPAPLQVVVHLGGGLHHAFPNHGEGFCLFNDVAVAVRVLQTHGFERVAIVDLDVHHGNGTAFIFQPDGAPLLLARSQARPEVAGAGVFTLSMHQQHNYPMWKPRGTLDIGLPDGTHDRTYLSELTRALSAVLAFRPRCVFYLAGADPYEDDQLGGLRLTKEGLRERDRRVIEAVRSTDAALVIVLAGGYARRLDDTVSIHVATAEEAHKAARMTVK